MRVGTDIVEIQRLKAPSRRFLEKILAENERADYDSRGGSPEFLAGLWAAKEAYLKATGEGLGSLALKEIQVLHEEGGRPYLLVKGTRHEVSIAHDGGYAIAVVIIP